jgi:hypothetical protein
MHLVGELAAHAVGDSDRAGTEVEEIEVVVEVAEVGEVLGAERTKAKRKNGNR